MEYRVYGQDVVVRMDRGEEILDCIRHTSFWAPSPGSARSGK